MFAETVTSRTNVCLVIGDPIAHSLSPAMHNAAYAALQLPFVMAAAHVTADNLADAIRGVRALGIRGLACTMPHKVALLDLLDDLDPTAKRIGAVNTVVNREGRLTGYNTDWLGIITPLEQITPLSGKRVALLGAGGAASAAVYGCIERGATVTVYNRTQENAENLATRFGCTIGDLANTKEIAEADIVINTTAVGMGALAGQSPLPASTIRKGQIVFETIYAPYTTTLVEEALAADATVLRGLDMFLEQGIAQFEFHTGVKPPRAEMERILRTAADA